MSKSPSLGPWVAGQLQSSAEEAIKRPVKEAVKEALAETNQIEGGNVEAEPDTPAAESRRIDANTSDMTDDESSEPETAATDSASGSRIRRQLRPRRMLALVVIALGVYLRRRQSSTRDK